MQARYKSVAEKGENEGYKDSPGTAWKMRGLEEKEVFNDNILFDYLHS